MSLYKEFLNNKSNTFIPYFDCFNLLEIDEGIMLSYLLYYNDYINAEEDWMEISLDIIRSKRPNWTKEFIKKALENLCEDEWIFYKKGNGRGNLYKLNTEKIFKLIHLDTKKRKNITYSKLDEALDDQDFFNKFKGSKNPRVLISWTRRIISDKACADALISWISLMVSNNKWQTLSLFNDKIAFIYDNKGTLNPLDIINDTIEKGYFSFSYSIDYLNKKNKSNKWNDKIKLREETEDTSKIKLRSINGR